MFEFEQFNVLKKWKNKKEKKVIASDENLEKVITILEEKGENPAFLLTEFVYTDNTVVLL